MTCTGYNVLSTRYWQMGSQVMRVLMDADPTAYTPAAEPSWLDFFRSPSRPHNLPSPDLGITIILSAYIVTICAKNPWYVVRAIPVAVSTPTSCKLI